MNLFALIFGKAEVSFFPNKEDLGLQSIYDEMFNYLEVWLSVCLQGNKTDSNELNLKIKTIIKNLMKQNF